MRARRWLSLFGFVCGLAFLLACGAPAENILVQTAAYEGVIFHQELAQKQKALTAFVTDHEDYRTLMVDDIAELESHLSVFMAGANPEIAAKLDQYKRQYVGFWRQGKLYVLVNAFCQELHGDWRQQMLIVMDGGDCYFQVEYDITEATFSRLHVNGES